MTEWAVHPAASSFQLVCVEFRMRMTASSLKVNCLTGRRLIQTQLIKLNSAAILDESIIQVDDDDKNFSGTPHDGQSKERLLLIHAHLSQTSFFSKPLLMPCAAGS